jgi:hypothetical protein
MTQERSSIFIRTKSKEQRGWSLMIFCARATRGLRRVGGEWPDHSSCSPRPTIGMCSLDALSEGQSGHSPWAKVGKIGKPSPGLMARLGVPVGGRVRKLRAIEDQSAPIPEEITSGLGGSIDSGARATCALGKCMRGLARGCFPFGWFR